MNPIYWLGWIISRATFSTYFRWRVIDAHHVPSEGPLILASNHASFLDPPLIGAGVSRPLNYLARETLFRYPGIGWLLHRMQAVPVDPHGGASGLRAILERLLMGGAIVLFIEGTRTRDGQLQPPRSGVGLTVLKSTAPVVPVRVFGTFAAYGRRTPIPLPHRLTVRYGKPMDFASLRTEAKTCSKARMKEIYQEIAAQIMARIEALTVEG